NGLLHYLGSRAAVPSLVVDITSVYDLRREAILCYRSQFYREGSPERATRIAHPDFLPAVEGKSRAMGALIGASFGEAYTAEEPIAVEDLVSLYSKKPWEEPTKKT